MKFSIILVWLFFFTACDQHEHTSLKIATNQWPGYEPLYLAQQLGFHTKAEFKFIEMHSATEVMNAFNLKKVDIAALTLDEVLLLTENNDDLRVFLVLDISNGADKLIAKKTISSLSELKGKRIGVEKTALGAFFTSQILEASNLTSADVTLVATTHNNHYSMMQAGKIDAVVTFEPVATQLQQNGHHSLFDSSQIPGKIVDVLVTRKQVLERHEHELTKLVASHWKTLKFINDNPVEASQKMAPRLKITAKQFQLSYDGLTLPEQQANKELLDKSLIKTAETLIKVMKHEALIKHTVNSQELITARIVQ
jgi:NitT/TauT family transport system substrate-binding protein